MSGPRRRGPVRIVNVVACAVVAAIGIAGGFGELTISNTGGAVVSFVVGAFFAWYAVRLWTFRASRMFGPREPTRWN